MAIEAKLTWTEGLQFVARSGDGPAVILDSTEGKSGPTPMQMMLMGVAGCTAIDIVLIMKKKRTDLRRFEILITGDQAEDYPQRFTRMHIEYLLHGKGIKPSAVEQAIRLSEEKYCSARASVNAEVTSSYRIIESEEAAR